MTKHTDELVAKVEHLVSIIEAMRTENNERLALQKKYTDKQIEILDEKGSKTHRKIDQTFYEIRNEMANNKDKIYRHIREGLSHPAMIESLKLRQIEKLKQIAEFVAQGNVYKVTTLTGELEQLTNQINDLKGYGNQWRSVLQAIKSFDNHQ
jgi:proline dehydrogenase